MGTVAARWGHRALPRHGPRQRVSGRQCEDPPWTKAAKVSGLTAEAPAVSLLTRALAQDDLAGVGRALFNSLETPSIGKFPVLKLIKDTMRACGAAGALMSGSGATVFGLFAETEDAARAAEKVRAECGPSMWTQVAKTTG